MWHFSSIHSMHVSSVDTLWSVVVFFRIFSINAFHFIYFYRCFCSLHSWCELLPYPLQIFRLNDQRCNFFFASFSLLLVVDVSHFVCLNVVSSHRTAVGWLKWMFFCCKSFRLFHSFSIFSPNIYWYIRGFCDIHFPLFENQGHDYFHSQRSRFVSFSIAFWNRQGREREIRIHWIL